jgi:hypothetical protein
MKKTTIFALVCAGFAISFPAVAKDVPQSSEPSASNTSGNIIAQYRGNDRQFNVYYRDRYERRWTLENSYFYRRDAERASRRLERRGYVTYIQLTREVNRRYG